MFYTGILAVPLSRRRSDQRKEHIVNNIGDLTLIKRPHRHYEMVLIQVVHDASNSRREARWVDFASRDGIVEYPVEHAAITRAESGGEILDCRSGRPIHTG